MGTQKNRLIEMFLLSTQKLLKLMDKQIFTVLHSNVLFATYVSNRACVHSYVTRLFVLMLFVPVNNFSVKSGCFPVFVG